MAISFDNAAIADLADSATSADQTFSYTMGSGTDSVLVVSFCLIAGSLPASPALPITNVTFNGVALTHLASGVNSGVFGVNLVTDTWYLPSPPSGAHTIEVFLDNAYAIQNGIIYTSSYFGVNQGTVFGATSRVRNVVSVTTISVDNSNNITTTYDNSWLLTWFYLRTIPRGTYIQNLGTLRAQFSSVQDTSVQAACVDRGPLSPIGNYVSSVDTSLTSSIFGFQLALNPSKTGSVEYLIVAGGGGGGGSNSIQAGGGGGGGSVSSGTASVTETAFTATVGSGGGGGAADPTGQDSSIFSITSVKGGGGGSGSSGIHLNGYAGGTGGGGGSNDSGSSAGTGGTGSNGGAGGNGFQANNGTNSGGGGGGASGNGGNASAGDPTSDFGGAGVSSSITGSAVTYGGGGGGGRRGAGSGSGAGGSGGGGDGGSGGTIAGLGGADNFGGGGGASGGGSGAGGGGSGIVIIRYHTDGSDGVSPASTGGVKTTFGAYTIHTFTTTGTFTVVFPRSGFLPFM